MIGPMPHEPPKAGPRKPTPPNTGAAFQGFEMSEHRERKRRQHAPVPSWGPQQQWSSGPDRARRSAAVPAVAAIVMILAVSLGVAALLVLL
jgi:hypothetical protein